MADEPFLSRWSRRKTEARTPDAPAAAPLAANDPVPPNAAPAPQAAEPLPSIESLTPDSDFTGFMKPDVEEGLRTRALRTLFKDPHFNVMDGLDTYIADYSQPDPLPESWLAQLKMVERLGDYKPPEPEDPEADPEKVEEAPAEALLESEKPLPEQGFGDDSATPVPDTGGAAIPPSPVR